MVLITCFQASIRLLDSQGSFATLTDDMPVLTLHHWPIHIKEASLMLIDRHSTYPADLAPLSVQGCQ